MLKTAGTEVNNQIIPVVIKGVTWHQKKFRAEIQYCGKRVYLGSFPTAEEAYVAYCKAAKKLHGEFAKIETSSF